MARLILYRVLTGVPTLLLLLTLVFFMMRAAPGGPFDDERSLPPEIETTLAAEYHLGDSLWQQYLRYVGNVLRGDLGPSFQYEGRRVSELIGQALPVSMLVGSLALALALALPGGIAIGAYAAFHRGTWIDRALMGLALIGISVPNFVVAPLLVLLFAIFLGWLPAGGWETGSLRSLVLPVVALALPQLTYIARLMRTSMAETLQAPFILTARAKGLPQRLILWRHAARPAVLPVVSYLGPAVAGLLTGSVVVEQVFGIPGVGRYFVQAALNRDYTLVLGVVLLYGLLIFLFNLCVDLLYGVLDPRVRKA